MSEALIELGVALTKYITIPIVVFLVILYFIRGCGDGKK